MSRSGDKAVIDRRLRPRCYHLIRLREVVPCVRRLSRLFLRAVYTLSAELVLLQRQLRWLVIRMPSNRLPRKVLHVVLIGQWTRGRQCKRLKDYIKACLKKCSIPFSQLEALAEDRNSCKSTCVIGLTNFMAVQDQTAEDRRTRRPSSSSRTASGPSCPTCNRTCASELGLRGIHLHGLTQILHDDLHWLDVADRVTYKLGVIMHRCRHGNAPHYLVDCCTPVTDVVGRQRLRSATQQLMAVPDIG